MKISIVGNIRIYDIIRFEYLLASMRSFVFADKIIDSFQLNIENLDEFSNQQIKNIKLVGEHFNNFKLTKYDDFYGKTYIKLLSNINTNFFINFVEDQFCILDDLQYLDGIFNYDFELCSATFFALNQKQFGTKECEKFIIEQTPYGNIYNVDKECSEILRKNTRRLYYIGVDSIFSTEFGVKFWSRHIERKRPHFFERKRYSKFLHHKRLVCNKEILCAIDDNHGICNSSLLSRNDNKFCNMHHKIPNMTYTIKK